MSESNAVKECINLIETELDKLQSIGFGYQECDPSGPKDAGNRWKQFRSLQIGLDEIKKMIKDA